MQFCSPEFSAHFLFEKLSLKNWLSILYILSEGRKEEKLLPYYEGCKSLITTAFQSEFDSNLVCQKHMIIIFLNFWTTLQKSCSSVLLVGRLFYAEDGAIFLIYQLSSCVARKYLILRLRDMEIHFLGMTITAVIQTEGHLLAEQVCLGKELEIVWIHLIFFHRSKNRSWNSTHL